MKRMVAIPMLVAAIVALSGSLPSYGEDAASSKSADKECKAGDKNCKKADKACKKGDKACKAHGKTCNDHVSACIKKCETTVKTLESKNGDPKLISTLKECIEMCKAHKANKASGKDCAEKCNACAKACEDAKDAALKSCADECKSCASCCEAEKS